MLSNNYGLDKYGPIYKTLLRIERHLFGLSRFAACNMYVTPCVVAYVNCEFDKFMLYLARLVDILMPIEKQDEPI